MSTFVLIHGGGHGGWCYAKVKARLEAATPRNGQSLVDHAGPTLELARPAGTTVDGMELVLLPSAEAGLFYGVTDPEDLAWMADRLTPQPWACFAQKLLLTNEDALSKVPQFHVVCESTLLSRDPNIIEPARAEGRLWSIDTGHDLMITEPDFVTGALTETASA